MMKGKAGRTARRIVVFTDLDGTLLDASTYSFDAAGDALALVKKRHIPLVVCSSKTRAEIEYYRSLLENEGPFISENGGGVFIPGECSRLTHALGATKTEHCGRYLMVRLGAPYGRLRDALEALRAEGFDVRGFGDMTVGEVSELTGLTPKEAAMAKEREFDEPFTFNGDAATREALLRSVAARGFNVTRGRFFHLLGDSDKGKAVSLLARLYEEAFGKILTVGIGDSPNDIPMLQAVDMPVAVQKEDGTYDPAIDVPGLVRAPGIGPEGWDGFVKSLVKD